MKNKRHAIRKNIRLLPILLSTMGAMLFIGHGCGSIPDEVVGSESFAQCQVEEKLVEPEFGEITASLVYGRQVLDNMVACTGIQIASATTEAEYNNRSASFSEFGIATEVSGPMLMGIAAVAGEVCNDLLKLEEGAAAVDRDIFDLVDFSDSATMSTSEIEGTAKGLAVNCWGRQPTAEDLIEIVSGTQESLAMSQGGGDTPNRDAALFICTSILASLDGLVQ